MRGVGLKIKIGAWRSCCLKECTAISRDNASMGWSRHPLQGRESALKQMRLVVRGIRNTEIFMQKQKRNSLNWKLLWILTGILCFKTICCAETCRQHAISSLHLWSDSKTMILYCCTEVLALRLVILHSIHRNTHYRHSRRVEGRDRREVQIRVRNVSMNQMCFEI